MGREKQGVVHREPLWFRVVLDAIAKSRATKMPLDRELSAMIKRARLGKNDRKAARDVAFSYARHQAGIENVIDEELKRFGGVRAQRREIDRAALIMASIVAEHDAPGVQVPGALADVIDAARTQGAGTFVSALQQLPKWTSAYLSTPFENDDEVKALLSRAPVTLACASSEARDEVLKRLLDNDVDAEASEMTPYAIRSKRHIPRELLANDEKVWPMDEGSQCIALSLGVKAGDKVLDLCAGGGGKSRLLKNLGAHVVSGDVNAKRLQETPEGVRVLLDGRAPPFGPVFDAVLIDAPCTGSGTLRRSPDIFSRMDKKTLEDASEVQKALLNKAASMVKPGGVLVYATCSILAPENEDQVKKGVSGLEPAPFEDWFCETLKVEKGEHMMHLTPLRHQSDGFFVARFQKPLT